MSKATSNAHDWPCGEPDTYGWRGEACRKYPTAASEITTLREQVKKLEALVVMRCDLDVPPQFSQGLQSHEFLEPVTAEHCQWFVAEIEKLTKERKTRLDLAEQNKQLKAELKSIDGALNDPRANLTLTTSEIIWELKGQIEKLKAENEDWRNNRYTNLWKLRTEDRGGTIAFSVYETLFKDYLTQSMALKTTQVQLKQALKTKQFFADRVKTRRNAYLRLRRELRSILRELPPCRFKDEVNAAIDAADDAQRPTGSMS